MDPDEEDWRRTDADVSEAVEALGQLLRTPPVP
jgi:hypothetical protein